MRAGLLSFQTEPLLCLRIVFPSMLHPDDRTRSWNEAEIKHPSEQCPVDLVLKIAPKALARPNLIGTQRMRARNMPK